MIHSGLSIFSSFYYLHFRNEKSQTSELMGRWSKGGEVEWVRGGDKEEKNK